MDLPIGAHTPNAYPLHEASERDADLVQIFLSNPQGWKKPNPRSDTEDLRRAAMPIYVHAPYLINMCADNNRVRIPSRRILQETCDAATEIDAEAVVVHAGHVTGDGPTGDGLLRWRKALEALDTDMTVLIENTAGGDKALGRRVEWLARLWEEIGEFGPGFVLDTCHAWAGGEPLDGLVSRVREATGRIDLVHLNDSRDEFDSRRDRHANLGKGKIPLDVMVGIVAEAGVPVVVETPDLEGQIADIALIRTELAEIDTGLGDDE